MPVRRTAMYIYIYARNVIPFYHPIKIVTSYEGRTESHEQQFFVK